MPPDDFAEREHLDTSIAEIEHQEPAGAVNHQRVDLAELTGVSPGTTQVADEFIFGVERGDSAGLPVRDIEIPGLRDSRAVPDPHLAIVDLIGLNSPDLVSSGVEHVDSGQIGNIEISVRVKSEARRLEERARETGGDDVLHVLAG